MKELTVEQVIARMRKQQGERTDSDYARELGISKPYLSDIYSGRRDPGPKILRTLNLKKRVVRLYESTVTGK